MLYLLFVLTFLAGILFYGMSPRDDKLQMDDRQAEGMIISFINQHQAAKDYIYEWLGVTSRVNNNQANLQDTTLLRSAFENLMPRGVVPDMCAGNTGVPGNDSCNDGDSPSPSPIPGFISQIVCTNAEGTVTTNCTDPEAKKYLITYGGWECTQYGEGNCISFDRPSWWPRKGTRMRKFERWRRAITNRTRDSASCGVLFQKGADWCIDNGKTIYANESVDANALSCKKKVPSAVIGELPNNYRGGGNPGLHDLLFCLSEFKQGWREYYTPGATYFYDGRANAGEGQHASGGSVNWVNLVNTDQSITNLTFPQPPFYTINSSSSLNTGITLTPPFTLTILAEVPSASSSPFPLFGYQPTEGSPTTVFQKSGLVGTAEYNTEAFELSAVEGHPAASACNMQRGGTGSPKGISKQLISWTFVVKREGGTPKIDVYENTVKRNHFSGKEITIPPNSTLIIGGNNTEANIYGIRYYARALDGADIRKNFKVDQKRFSIPDVNNGQQRESCVNESGSPDQIPKVYFTKYTPGGGE